jgi:predicted aldo/keto reductase-like oxidoreductase
MSVVSRREFIAGLTAAAGTTVLAGRLAWADPATKIKKGTDLVKLGRTGIRTTVLGIGTGTHSGDQQRALGQAGFTKLVRHGLDRGLKYIDTADSYRAHPFVRNALEGVPRDKYFIQTKIGAKTADRANKDIERFLEELHIEYIDSLLMHAMFRGDWVTQMRPVMDVLQEAKEKGKVRAVGISCHGWDPLAASVDADWPDVQLVRINPFGIMMDGPGGDERDKEDRHLANKVAALVKKMHDKGRGIIGMKIYGETGFGSKEKRLQSLKYVLGLGSVDCFTIGFTSIAQFDETLELIEQAQA